MIKLDLSELPIAPHQYRLAGIVLLGSGFVMLILGLFLAFSTQFWKADGMGHMKISADACIDRVGKLGLKALPDGDKIRVYETDMTQTVQLLAESSQAISLCPDWKLSQYCLGKGCKPPGLSMILQYNEQKK